MNGSSNVLFSSPNLHDRAGVVNSKQQLILYQRILLQAFSFSLYWKSKALQEFVSINTDRKLI